MIDQLLSMALGGAMRLAPEVLDFFDRKNRRQHEKDMADRQAQHEKDMADRQAQNTAIAKEGDALTEAIKSQSVLTGVKWADALNIAVRPIVTYWWVIVLYTAYLVASFVVLVNEGGDIARSIVILFGDKEKALVNTIVSFWFVDRAIRYTRGKQ